MLKAAVRGAVNILHLPTLERGAFCGDLPSGFSGQQLVALIRAGHPDLASPWCGEVTVGKAGHSNPSLQLECQNYRILYTLRQSLNSNKQHLSVLVLISRHIVDQF